VRAIIYIVGAVLALYFDMLTKRRIVAWDMAWRFEVSWSDGTNAAYVKAILDSGLFEMATGPSIPGKYAHGSDRVRRVLNS
jgi:hypothetical protein